MSRSQISTPIPESEVEQLLSAFPEGVVGLDLETTGLSPLTDRIIEIAAYKVNKDGKIETFHSLVNPIIEIPEFTIRIHGITNDMVKDAPIIENTLMDLMDFIGNKPIVAHNALFDAGFIAKDLHYQALGFPDVDVYDSCKLARAGFKYGEEKPMNFKLSTICDYFEIPLNHHVAMDDTVACLRIVAKSLAKFPQKKNLLEKSFIYKMNFFNKFKHDDLSVEGKQILSMINKKEKGYIVYSGGTLGSTPRKIRPIGLMPWQKGPILYAECCESKLNKSFHLKKIQKVLTFSEYQEKYANA